MTLLTTTPTGLVRDGQPHLIVSGAMHYFRVHPDLWQDRLRRLVAMGCNTLETYVAWNFHAPDPTTVRFDGWADLGAYLDLAAEEDLDVIVRPGPYICAEWEGGGLPGWLTSDPTLRVRCHDERYLAAVDDWFDQLVPVVAERQASRGGRVVAVQVENEYGSYGDDQAYLEHLRDGLRRRGIDELLVTSDGPSHAHLAAGSVTGAWATMNFGSRTREVLDFARTELPDQPQMCMEFWNGWFDHWGGTHHVRDAADAANELGVMLDNGMSVNFYMANGGTNFGLWSGANNYGTLQPTVTSYDYDAPIAEDGRLTPKFHAFREVIARHRSLPPLQEHLDRLAIDPDPAAVASRELPWQALTPASALPTWRQAGRHAPHPPAFDGLERGVQLLRRRVELQPGRDGTSAPLVLHGLADRASVFVDGHRVAVVDGDTTPVEVALDVAPQEVLVELLVENRGRTNFGAHMGDRKGILGGVWHGTHFLNGWEVLSWPLEEMGTQLATEALEVGTPSEAPPIGTCLVGVARFELDAGESGNAFVDTSNLGRGVCWFDGFCLGRYDAVGPQRTLYVPSPLVTPGTHCVTVLELDHAAPRLRLADGPLLGPVD